MEKENLMITRRTIFGMTVPSKEELDRKFSLALMDGSINDFIKPIRKDYSARKFFGALPYGEAIDVVMLDIHPDARPFKLSRLAEDMRADKGMPLGFGGALLFIQQELYAGKGNILMFCPDAFDLLMKAEGRTNRQRHTRALPTIAHREEYVPFDPEKTKNCTLEVDYHEWESTGDVFDVHRHSDHVVCYKALYWKK